MCRRRSRTLSNSLFRSEPLRRWPIASLKWPIAFDREAEQLGQLADQYRQRYSVHVAIADGLREKLGYETQPRHTCQDARDSGDDRHHAGERNRTLRVSAGQRSDDVEYDGGQRRVRPQRPEFDWGRTPRKPAAARWSRRDHRCLARPMLRHRRCRRAPTSSSVPAPRRCHDAAKLLDIGAA